jgi:hypothetical protein
MLAWIMDEARGDEEFFAKPHAPYADGQFLGDPLTFPYFTASVFTVQPLHDEIEAVIAKEA